MNQSKPAVDPAQLVDPLHDVQGYKDERGVALYRAGVKGVEMPIRLLQKDGGVQSVAANIAMGVYLPEDSKGTHMSRFIIQLAEWSKAQVMTLRFRELLSQTLERLGSNAAYLNMDFTYFVEKKAPVTDYSAPMAFACSFETELERHVKKGLTTEAFRLVLGVTVPISTLCPCSKQISDYGAHNQRAELRVKVRMNTSDEVEHLMVWLEDLIAALETTASCPVFPILKRVDEKWVTERQYDNPKFVEDVARDATVLLRGYDRVEGFTVEVEALESIHGHNAWAYHEESF